MQNIPIYEWVPPELRGSVYREEIDISDFWNVISWCRSYALRPPGEDTTNPLIRWNIGVYQLHYVLRMKIIGEYDAADFAESVASALLHMIMAYETVKDDAYEIVNVYEPVICEQKVLKPVHMDRLLCAIAGVTRQLLYLYMNRRNRYNKIELVNNFAAAFEEMWNFATAKRMRTGLELAIGKLQDLELRSH